MALEATSDQNRPSVVPTTSQFPVSGGWRLLYGVFVVILPSFSFWAIPGLEPEWQSGKLQDYLALLLQPEASVFFIILLVYSVVCYWLLLIDPERYSSSFAIRFGIYTGVLLALQYSIILYIYLSDDKYAFTIFLLWLFPLYFTMIEQWAAHKWGKARARLVLIILVFVASAILAVINREEFYPAFLVLVLVVMAAPFWSLLIALQAAIWLAKNHETTLTFPRGLGITAWLAAYAVAWRYDILKMYELYAKLPTEPPDCYIATAAARGHPGFVHSRRIELSGGTRMMVNRQLQILKCAELAMLVVTPRLHGWIRSIYDLVGKPLARTIRNPLLADAGYLLIKPAEWLAGFILTFIVPEINSISIYN